MAWNYDIETVGIVTGIGLGVLALVFNWKNWTGQKESNRIAKSALKKTNGANEIAKLALKHSKEANRVVLLNNFPRLCPHIRRYKDHIEYIIVNEGDIEADDSFLELDVYDEDDHNLLEKSCIGIIPSFLISGKYGEGPIPRMGDVKMPTSIFEAEPFQEGKLSSPENWKKNHLRSLFESDNLKLLIVIANDVERNTYCSCRYFFKNLQIGEPRFSEIEKRKHNINKKTNRCNDCRAFQLNPQCKEMKYSLLEEHGDALAWFFAKSEKEK